MNYKDYYNDILGERYGGAKKGRGIWYHGTSKKRLPTILTRGLQDVPAKNKSWNKQDELSLYQLDLSSYGGIYVSKSLLTAYSSAGTISRRDKSNRLIVIMELQPRSLISDEDDFSILMNYDGLLYQIITPYIVEMFGSDNDGDADDIWKTHKTDWINHKLESILKKEKTTPELYNTVKDILSTIGYRSMLIRAMSFANETDNYNVYWRYRETYSIIKGMPNYGKEFDIPDLPNKQEAETTFRKFIDKLTKTIKAFEHGRSVTARTLSPVKFSGKNRIICIVSIDQNNVVDVVYGDVPYDFEQQWIKNIGKLAYA